jgi:hypothetical protein
VMGLFLRRMGDGRARAIAQNGVLRKKQSFRKGLFDTMACDLNPPDLRTDAGFDRAASGLMHSTPAIATRRSQ